MFHSPNVAVVLEGGLVQTIIIEAWPPPQIIVVDCTRRLFLFRRR